MKQFFRVRLEKRIPAQAGMGGGSSNAAAAFFGANALCGRPASAAELIEWADDPVIGSDATFFLSEGTAYCTGRGEIVTPVDPLPVKPDLPVYLVKPKVGLSTPKVFKALDLEALSSVDPEDLLGTFREKGTSHSKWVNDLEQPAFVVEPSLGKLKAFLESDGGFGFEAVLMSGSGTTIYCLGDPGCGAESFAEATRGQFEIEGIWRYNHLLSGRPWMWCDILRRGYSWAVRDRGHLEVQPHAEVEPRGLVRGPRRQRRHSPLRAGRQVCSAPKSRYFKCEAPGC